MILHVEEARYVRDFMVWLRFNDGAEGEVDLKDELFGEVFEPLQDVTQRLSEKPSLRRGRESFSCRSRSDSRLFNVLLRHEKDSRPPLG